MAEILRTPLGNCGQCCSQRHSPECHHDNFGAIRIEAGSAESEHSENGPQPDYAKSVLLRRAPRASQAMGAIIARPNVKLPCRLAHSVISGSRSHGGDLRMSTARINRAIHATVTGSPRM